MVPDISSQNPVLPIISGFCPKARALFALAMTHHQSPNFQLWCLMEDKRIENLAPYEKCFNYLSTFLQGHGSDKGISSRREEISKLMQLCYDDDCIGGALAGDCISALDIAYECALDEDDSGAAEVSMMALAGAVSRFNEDVEQPDNDKADDIFAAELEFQMQIANEIKKANLNPSSKISCSVIKDLLAEVEEHGISNIGLEFNLLEDEEDEHLSDLPF